MSHTLREINSNKKKKNNSTKENNINNSTYENFTKISVFIY